MAINKCPPGKKLVGGKCISLKGKARTEASRRVRLSKSNSNRSKLTQRLEKPVMGGVTFR